MAVVDDLAAFSVGSSSQHLTPQAVEQLQVRVLGSLGCALGAVNADPVRRGHTRGHLTYHQPVEPRPHLQDGR
jgi:hypothetical protein